MKVRRPRVEDVYRRVPEIRCPRTVQRKPWRYLIYLGDFQIRGQAMRQGRDGARRICPQVSALFQPSPSDAWSPSFLQLNEQCQ